ncbi:endonuclease III domain-containing protein [Nanoarchaeota archaeon]
MIKKIYNILYKAYGPQGWWPLTPRGGVESLHHQGCPQTDRDRFEICCGAILTQNTNWKNVEKALKGLSERKLVDPARLRRVKKDKIAGLIRSAGYFNQKAERLLLIGKKFEEMKDFSRDELLGLKGVGPETADSMLLYAFEKESFVVDAYTKRIFSRLGLCGPDAGYDEIQKMFVDGLRNKKNKLEVYKEYHALIVEHAKRYCKTKPECDGCGLICRFRHVGRDL